MERIPSFVIAKRRIMRRMIILFSGNFDILAEQTSVVFEAISYFGNNQVYIVSKLKNLRNANILIVTKRYIECCNIIHSICNRQHTYNSGGFS